MEHYAIENGAASSGQIDHKKIPLNKALFLAKLSDEELIAKLTAKPEKKIFRLMQTSNGRSRITADLFENLPDDKAEIVAKVLLGEEIDGQKLEEEGKRNSNHKINQNDARIILGRDDSSLANAIKKRFPYLATAVTKATEKAKSVDLVSQKIESGYTDIW